MKVVEISKATTSLGDYARRLRKRPVVVTRKGRPVAALVPIENADLETISLSTNPKFLAIIERSRQRMKTEGGIPMEEMRRRLGLQ
jgi:prevent-host-death family protein